LEPKDRIAELCNRAVTENDPPALKKILDELKAALAEYIREARLMTVLHFDYFRKHDEFSSKVKSPTEVENIKKVEDVNEDVNKDLVEDVTKKAS